MGPFEMCMFHLNWFYQTVGWWNIQMQRQHLKIKFVAKAEMAILTSFYVISKPQIHLSF